MVVRLTQSYGMLLLGIWLILHGAILAFGLSFRGEPLVMGILGIVAGVLILIQR
jgi:hypothetical protein